MLELKLTPVTEKDSWTETIPVNMVVQFAGC